MKMKPALCVLALLVSLSSCCATRKPNGTVYVVPEWEGNSRETYLRWMKDPDKKGHIEAFSALIKKEIQTQLGSKFPVVCMPAADSKLAALLALSGDAFANDTRNASARADGPAAIIGSASDFEASEAEELLQKIVNEVEKAVQAHNPNLSTAYQGNGYTSEVSYIIEDNVTYCVYATFVAKYPEGGTEGEWWSCTYPEVTIPEDPAVTAYLNLYAVVREIE